MSVIDQRIPAEMLPRLPASRRLPVRWRRACRCRGRSGGTISRPTASGAGPPHAAATPQPFHDYRRARLHLSGHNCPSVTICQQLINCFQIVKQKRGEAHDLRQQQGSCGFLGKVP